MPLSHNMKRFVHDVPGLENSSGMSMPKYRKWALILFLWRVWSFVSESLNLINERISVAALSGTYMPLSSPDLKLLASLPLSTASVFLNLSPAIVGTSAGLTTMCVSPDLSAPNVSRTRRIQLHILSDTPHPDRCWSETYVIQQGLDPVCTSSILTVQKGLSLTNFSNAHPIRQISFVLWRIMLYFVYS